MDSSLESPEKAEPTLGWWCVPLHSELECRVQLSQFCPHWVQQYCFHQAELEEVQTDCEPNSVAMQASYWTPRLQQYGKRAGYLMAVLPGISDNLTVQMSIGCCWRPHQLEQKQCVGYWCWECEGTLFWTVLQWTWRALDHSVGLVQLCWSQVWSPCL